MIAASPGGGGELRPATDADSAGVVALVDRCWSQYPGCVFDLDVEMGHLLAVASHFEQLGGRAYVLARQLQVLASVAWVPAADTSVELRLLYVLPEARRRGVGAALVALVESDAAARHASSVVLWSDTRFTDAHRLYRRTGYRQSAAVRELHDLSATVEYRFEKVLAPPPGWVGGAR